MEFDNEIIIQQLTNQLKSAYRKYKTAIYYDSYSSIQRLKLSEFESNPKLAGKNYDIENIFEELAKNYC